MSPHVRPQRHNRFETAFSVGSGIMKFKTTVLSTAVLAAIAALATPMQARAADFYLKAQAITIPDPNGGAAIPMWAYSSCTDGSGASCGAATVPGPALVVPAGDTVLNVTLINALPQPTSLVINGLYKPMTPVWNDGSTGNRPSATARVRSFDAEAAAGTGTASYTWSNVKPGTYLYQSGTHPQVQVQMGLYGAMTQNAAEASTTPAEAYPGIAYDNQATLFYSEIDPALHAAVADGSYGTTGPTSTFDYQPKYFLINGEPYPNANSVITPVGAPGTTLLRMLNAGLTTHVPMIDGTHWTAVAEDGKAYPYANRLDTALLTAAKTMDVLLTPNAGGAVYPIMDRRLNLSNNGLAEGGMLAFLQYSASGTVGGASGSNLNPPIAVADTYNSVTGVTLNVGAAQGVLVNDDNTDGLPLPIKAVAASGATLNGGSYTLNANGSFTYTPGPGNPAVDSFTYQVTDGQALSNLPATVTINLATPAAPTLAVLDNFDRAASTNLGAGWSQTVATVTSAPDIQGTGTEATAATIGLGGLAIWNAQDYLENQYAGFTSSTPLTGSALVLKASGGTSDAAAANYVRVRCEAADLVVATMMSGSNMSVYVTQASFPAAACGSSGTLSAAVDDKGIVTTFVNGTYVGGVQLPDVAAWKGQGKIGIQLQTQGATIDDFAGGSL